MRSMRHFLLGLALCTASAGAEPGLDFQSASTAPVPPHPELYSFADVFRLTVSGAALASFPVAEGPIRVAVSEARPDVQFVVAGVPQPGKWLLIASGLALAGWVARRRLGYSA